MEKGLTILGGIALVSFLIATISCVSKDISVTETYYETEYNTEYRTETYTEAEDVVIKTIDGKQEIYSRYGWFSHTLHITGGEGIKTYYYHYPIDTNKHTRSQVKIIVYPATYGYIGIYDLTGIGEINPPPTPSVWEYQAMVSQRNKWVGNLNSILADTSRLLGSYKKSLYTSSYIDTDISNEISFDANGIKEFAIFTSTKSDNVISSVELSWSDDIIKKQMVTKERQIPYEVPVQVEKQRAVIQTKKVPFWEAISH